MGIEEIKQFIAKKVNIFSESRPYIFDLQNEEDRERVSAFILESKIQYVVDDYREQLKELFQVRNPILVYMPDFEDQFSRYVQNIEEETPLWQHGRWICFPWLSTLVHILEENSFQTVRTARNKNLINEDEQNKFYHSVIGIAGLSVGNSIALAIVLQGGGQHLRLADHDRLALSNTNRIRTGVHELGLSKVEMTARHIYALNPYAKVELFAGGLTSENISHFFEGPPKLDLVIDELDNLAIKFLIREQAKEHKLTVLMGADNGDNAIIDIERYDLNPQPDYFHGHLGRATYDELLGLDKFGIGKTITKMLGPENITIRMQQSLLEMGKTIVSWPQLGGAALLNGSVIAYCARKLLTGQELESNRALISLDERLIPNYNDQEQMQKREEASNEFKKIFKL
ncbi:MAG: ThiF family adenylyltransferase [Patescibacteria group bacterium]